MDFYAQRLKKRIWRTRIVGIVSALTGIAYVLFYYFNIVNHWLCAVMITYVIALNFLINSTYQEIFSGLKISKLNLSIAILFLLCTIALLAYTIVTAKLGF